MNCNACNKGINNKEFLKCRLCLGKFHYQCLNFERKQFLAFTSQYTSSWICPTCSNVTCRIRSNDNTPVRQNKMAPCTDDSMDMSCDNINSNITTYPPSPPPTSTCSGISLSGDEVTMDKISILLDQKLNTSLSAFMDNFRAVIREDIRGMVKTEIESAMKTIRDDFTTTTDYICAEQSSLRSDINKSSILINQLEKENSRLQTELTRMNVKLSAIEKISRNCNIEIQALPERRNENVFMVFKKLCDVIGVTIEDGNISACRRVAKMNGSSNRPRNVVISLSTPRIRDLVLSATHRYIKTRASRSLVSSDLDITGEPCRIFITEHLSPEQKALHAATRKLAKDLEFKYVWIKYGQIYVRKDDSASAILIKNMDTLSKLH